MPTVNPRVPNKAKSFKFKFVNLSTNLLIQSTAFFKKSLLRKL
nr:MAG TPA: hypothetical protein [Caudoviricetes sp.]